MIKVSKFFIKNLLEKKENNIPFFDEELDKFFCKNKSYYTACDNSSGECFIEDFKHIGAVYDFLNTDKPVEQIHKEDKAMGYNKEDS